MVNNYSIETIKGLEITLKHAQQKNLRTDFQVIHN